MSKWKAIKTAPKDRAIVIWSRSWNLHSDPVLNARIAMWTAYGWSSLHGGTIDVHAHADLQPTHWLDIPDVAK